MKLSELKFLVNEHAKRMLPDEDPEVVIQLNLPLTTIGKLMSVNVKSVYPGFDWNKGTFIVQPEAELTPADRDFAKQMYEMQEKWGWSEYENRNLRAEVRRLQKKLNES